MTTETKAATAATDDVATLILRIGALRAELNAAKATESTLRRRRCA